MFNDNDENDLQSGAAQPPKPPVFARKFHIVLKGAKNDGEAPEPTGRAPAAIAPHRQLDPTDMIGFISPAMKKMMAEEQARRRQRRLTQTGTRVALLDKSGETRMDIDDIPTVTVLPPRALKKSLDLDGDDGLDTTQVFSSLRN